MNNPHFPHVTISLHSWKGENTFYLFSGHSFTPSIRKASWCFLSGFQMRTENVLTKILPLIGNLLTIDDLKGYIWASPGSASSQGPGGRKWTMWTCAGEKGEAAKVFLNRKQSYWFSFGVSRLMPRNVGRKALQIPSLPFSNLQL